MHGQYLSAGWPLDRRGGARPHGGTAGGPTRDSEAGREIAEHPFGSIKQWMNQGTFLLRGLEKVRAEFSLTALAYNFIRVVQSFPSSTAHSAHQRPFLRLADFTVRRAHDTHSNTLDM